MNLRNLLYITVIALLWFAAATKTYQLATEPIQGNRWFWLAVAQFEWWLGLFLLFGLFRRLTWAVTLITFGIFTFASGRLAFLGSASCGCFGEVHVDPRITVTIDACVFFLLLLFGSKKKPEFWGAIEWKIAACFLLGLTGSLVSVVAVAQFEPARLNASGQIEGEAQAVLVNPKSWLGKKFPLTSYCLHSKGLEKDGKLVFLYHDDCEKCRAIFDHWPDSLKGVVPIGKKVTDYQTVILGIPPFKNKILTKLTPCPFKTQLNNKHRWFIRTPVLLRLEAGRVAAVVTEDDSKALSFLKKEAGKKPLISVKGKRYDFGYIDPESTHRIVFSVALDVAEEQKMDRVVSECDCAQCIVMPKKVLPEKTARFEVVFKAPKKPIIYSKQLALFFEGTKKPGDFLTISARIGMPLRVESKFDCENVNFDTNVFGIIKIFNDGPKPIKLLYATSSNQKVYVPVSQEPIGSKKHCELNVYYKASKETSSVNVGKDSISLSIHTSCAAQRRLQVDIVKTSESDKEKNNF